MREHFESGKEVFHQGDVGDRIYIIIDGRAEVLRETANTTRTLAVLGHGEYFGEMAVLNSTTRNATVRCLDAMDVLSLPKKELNLLAANLPDLRGGFERMSEHRRSHGLYPDRST